MKRRIILPYLALIPITLFSIFLLANCKPNKSAEVEATTETVTEATTTAESEAEVKASLELKVESKPEAEAQAAAQITYNPVFQPEAPEPLDLKPVGQAIELIGLYILVAALALATPWVWHLLKMRRSAREGMH